ncbi:MAG TPA: division plane positioning ATPase MipZ [Gaiellaceae bacterium]|nr:division plane positioning ATPase MipZ [Gaiellaceae bacterium]
MLRDPLGILRRRAWIVVAAGLLGAGGALAFALREQPRYAASAEVALDPRSVGDVLAGVSAPADPARLARSQAVAAHTPALARRVLRAAGPPGLDVGEFLAHSSVSVVTGANVLTFRVVDWRRDVATRLATAYAELVVRVRRELDAAAVAAERARADRQLARLRTSGHSRSPLYAALLARSRRLASAAAVAGSSARVVRRAGRARQVRPRTGRDVLLGLAAGLVAGLGLAVARERWDTRLHAAGQIGDELGLPVLGGVPTLARRLRAPTRLVLLDEPDGDAAEALRQLATAVELLARGGGREQEVLLVTSGHGGEGATTTTANLAVAFALAGRRVVAADLDLRRPGLHRHFALREQPGMADVALGRCRLEEALVAVPLPVTVPLPQPAGRAPALGRTLELLPCGAPAASPGELARSQALADVVAALRRRADVVLLDAPPVLGAADSLALSAAADAIIVVARLGRTRGPQLAELVRRLSPSPAPVLGVAVTGASFTTERSGDEADAAGGA